MQAVRHSKCKSMEGLAVLTCMHTQVQASIETRFNSN